MAGKGLSRHTQGNIFHRRDYEGYKACPPRTNLPIRSRRLVSGFTPFTLTCLPPIRGYRLLIFTITAMMGTIGVLRNIGVGVFPESEEEKKVDSLTIRKYCDHLPL